MMRFKSTRWSLLILAIVGVAAIIGCEVPIVDVDVTAPTVVSTAPVASEVGVLIDSVITVTFDEAMDAATITADNITLAAGLVAVPGAVTYDVESMTATFTPTDNLANGTEYTATVGVGVLDVAGNALASVHTWSFTTGVLGDTTRPTVTATVPADEDIDVAVNENITATFSEAMNAATITVLSFTVEAGGAVSGAVSYDAVTKTATFDPDADLASGGLHTVTISTVAADTAGNTLLVAKVWSFTTVVAPAEGPAPVLLGAAGNYVILAESAVDGAAGIDVITGSIGLSPAALSFVTGFALTAHEVSPGIIDYATAPEVVGDGKIYAADMTGGSTSSDLTTAVANKLTAYNDAAGRAQNDLEYDYFLNAGAGTIGAVTLTPGLHKWTSALNITGDVTFSGGPNDVWILQVAGTLDLAAGFDILLDGGALPKNIFWQVSGVTTLLAGSHFEGIILCASDIVLITGATMNGRALTAFQTVLQAATITQPAP